MKQLCLTPLLAMPEYGRGVYFSSRRSFSELFFGWPADITSRSSPSSMQKLKFVDQLQGTEDVIFKLFKKKFNSIDTTHLERWIQPENTDWRQQRAEDVLEWADLHMSEGTWPREDYREMVEFTVS